MTNPEMALAAAEAEIVAWEKLPPARQIKIRAIRRRALAFLREVEILGLVADEEAIETLKRLANAPIGELAAKDDDGTLKWLDAAEADLAKNRPVIRPRRIAAASLDGKPVPDREWLVPGLIPAGNVTLLYGDGGTGKSLVALQLAASKAVGALFFGRPVDQGCVEYLTAEDSLDELHRRLVDVARSMGKPLSAIKGLNLTSLADHDALLAIPEGGRSGALAVTTLYNEVDQVLAESKPTLLVLDTLADIYGGDEVVRHQVRQFIGMLRRLCLRHRCTIIVLAHPSVAGMDKGTSGSTAWNNSVRSRLFLSRIFDNDGQEDDEDARVLRVGKSNYGRVGAEIFMQFKNGAFVDPIGEGTAGNDPLTQSWKAERVFLELLDKNKELNIKVSAHPTSPVNAPKVFSKDARKKGVTKRDLHDAMQRLLDKKQIETAPEGPPSKMRYWLQRTYRPDAIHVVPTGSAPLPWPLPTTLPTPPSNSFPAPTYPGKTQ
ncbi:AAA family ATPase [Bradyrhizobium sp. S3.5.5]|uniref:AAA family ATPase n=1 Tax=Bradyrhizobium sp. S3.5.5 TaxID=3156430 RepID=UPI00339A2B9E